MIDHPQQVRPLRRPIEQEGRSWPFEAWVNGLAQPAAFGAVKTLSMDMRANDHAWLSLKLESLAKTPDGEGLTCPTRRTANKQMPSVVSALGQTHQYRVEQLGVFERRRPDAGARRPVQPQGTEDRHRRHAVLDGRHPTRRPAKTSCSASGKSPCPTASPPYSVWLSGNYPRALDGLTKLLSLDMRVIDPAWIGMKLKAARLRNRSATSWPSSPARASKLAVHRGLHRQPDHPPLRHARHPRQERLPAPADGYPRSAGRQQTHQKPPPASCAANAATSMIRDGCDCTACGAGGASCG